MRKMMQAAVEKGVPLLDAIDQAGFDDRKDTRLYESSQRDNAGFVYREMEQEFFSD